MLDLPVALTVLVGCVRIVRIELRLGHDVSMRGEIGLMLVLVLVLIG